MAMLCMRQHLSTHQDTIMSLQTFQEGDYANLGISIDVIKFHNQWKNKNLPDFMFPCKLQCTALEM